jgi:hypothetical protein
MALNDMLKYATPDQHDMHLVLVKDKAICLYFVVKAKLKFALCF